MDAVFVIFASAASSSAFRVRRNYCNMTIKTTRVLQNAMHLHSFFSPGRRNRSEHHEISNMDRRRFYCRLFLRDADFRRGPIPLRPERDSHGLESDPTSHLRPGSPPADKRDQLSARSKQLLAAATAAGAAADSAAIRSESTIANHPAPASHRSI